MLQKSILAAIRAALCNRIDEAALAAQRLARPNVSMPSSLLAAGLYLANADIDDEPSPGEQYFAWGPRAYRRYLDRLSPEVRAIELEAGRRVILEGRGGRPPLIASDIVQGENPSRGAA